MTDEPGQEQQRLRDLAEARRGMPERTLARQLVNFTTPIGIMAAALRMRWERPYRRG